MLYREMKAAKVGDRVCFKPMPGDAGEYAEGTIQSFTLSKRTCTVLWDDGVISTVNDATYDRIHLMKIAPTNATSVIGALLQVIDQMAPHELKRYKLTLKNQHSGAELQTGIIGVETPQQLTKALVEFVAYCAEFKNGDIITIDEIE